MCGYSLWYLTYPTHVFEKAQIDFRVLYNARHHLIPQIFLFILVKLMRFHSSRINQHDQGCQNFSHTMMLALTFPFLLLNFFLIWATVTGILKDKSKKHGENYWRCWRCQNELSKIREIISYFNLIFIPWLFSFFLSPFFNILPFLLLHLSKLTLLTRFRIPFWLYTSWFVCLGFSLNVQFTTMHSSSANLGT